jgi:ATP-dependent DNA helicase RecG
MRNSYKYTRLYSGADPEFVEGDVFEIRIPLTTGSMIKVGPGTSPVSGGEVSGQVVKSSGQVAKSSGQVEDVIAVKLDITKINSLIEYCGEPRTRAELQAFCEISSRYYFRHNVLNPLLDSGRLKRTIPDKPNSSNQKYIRA